MSRLKKKYIETVKPKLHERFGYKNCMQIPALKKVIVNMGFAEACKDKNAMQEALSELSLITGQKPILTKSRLSIAGFKLRKGQVIGAKVTLRGKRMYDFVDRFFNIVCPRIRDFRGFPRKCDGRGSYSLGIDDQQVFPEVNLDLVKRTQGMNVTFVTSSKTDEECVELLTLLGLPYKEA